VLRLVSSDAMYTRFCGTPAAGVHVCPNVGWFKDFQDAQTVLDPPFHGDNIQPTNNVNWSQLDVPEIDRLMDEAATVTDPAERARAWAEVNRKVTEAVPGIPYQWDIQNLVRSEDVAAVANRQLGMWDLSFTALR
jgi:peptide/nickel transport system substrate-binding protein